MRVLAAIVAYNPDHNRLLENIKAVKHQVDGIAIFNNGGLDSSTFQSDIIILSQGRNNIGIATALNLLCKYGKDNGFDWVLSLDQDSVVPNGLVDAYKNYWNNGSIAILCPSIYDRNYGTMAYDTGSGKTIDEVDACITSGSLMRLSAWEKVQGFWDELFIDMVDFDICWSLKEAGYKIVRVNNQVLLQEIGKAKKVTLFGKENVVYNHSPQRCYYMIRNTLAVGRKHHRKSQCLRWVLKRILLINLFEGEKLHKDQMILRGIIDGLRFKL